MNLSYKENVRHRTYGSAPVMAQPCEPAPNLYQFERTYERLRAEHPDWSAVRVRQRAMVEVYFEGDDK